MTLQQRIFKGMPEYKRRSIINLVINTQGLQSPRPKSFKDRDQENFGRKKQGTLICSLFAVALEQHLS